jgi:hypothetical protein
MHHPRGRSSVSCAVLIALAALVGGCAPSVSTGVVTAGQTQPASLERCDDGGGDGDGGVLIDGVCL